MQRDHPYIMIGSGERLSFVGETYELFWPIACVEFRFADAQLPVLVIDLLQTCNFIFALSFLTVLFIRNFLSFMASCQY